MARNTTSHHKIRPMIPPGVGIASCATRTLTDISPTVTDAPHPTSYPDQFSDEIIEKHYPALVTSVNRWQPESVALSLNRRCHRKHLLLLPGPADNLDSYRQSLGGLTHRNNRRWIPNQVKPFGVAPGIKIVDCLPFNRPGALSMTERWNGGRRTKQNWKVPHLR